MVKKAKAFAGGNGDDPQEYVERVKVATMVPKTIINGHVLTVGTVVELTEEEIANHRSHGMCLDDVAADDNREVFDVNTPYEAKGDD